MASNVVDTSFWIRFFSDAGIPSVEATAYAIKFTDNRIQKSMLLDLNKDYLNDMGIMCLGDIIAILKHAKSYHDKMVREKTLQKIDGPHDTVKVAAVPAAARYVPPNAPAAVAALPQEKTASRPTLAARLDRPQSAAADAAAGVLTTEVAAARGSSTSKKAPAGASGAVARPRQSPAGRSASVTAASQPAAALAGARGSSAAASRPATVRATASTACEESDEAAEPDYADDVSDDDDDEQTVSIVHARSDAGQELRLKGPSHRAVLLPRKRPSTAGTTSAVVAKKRLTVTTAAGATASSTAVSKSKTSSVTSVAATSHLSVSPAVDRRQQRSIFSRLGSSDDLPAAAKLDKSPDLTVAQRLKAARSKQQSAGDDMAASVTPDVGSRSRKRISAADDAKAAARVLAATARIAVAGVNDASKRIRLSVGNETSTATSSIDAENVPRKRSVVRTLKAGSVRSAASGMVSDSKTLSHGVKQRLGLAAGDSSDAAVESSNVPVRVVARVGSGRITATSSAIPTSSAASASPIGSSVLSRIGGRVALGDAQRASSGTVARGSDLRKRIGSPVVGATSRVVAPVRSSAASADSGGDGEMARSSVFNRLGSF